MSEARVAILIATIFFAAVCGALTPHPAQVPEETADSQGSQSPDETVTVAPLTQQGQALVERECEEYPQTAEQADLCQQWRMAVATMEIERIARRQFYVMIGEVAGLFLIVLFTLVAIRQTKSAIARDRAWMVSDQPITVTPIVGSGGRVTGCHVHVNWRNSGGSPALDALCGVDDEWVPSGQESHGASWQGAQQASTTGVIVGAEGTTRSAAVRLSHQDLVRIRDTEDRFIIYGTIRYRDIYTDEPRESFAAWDFFFEPGTNPLANEKVFSAHRRLDAFGRYTAT